VGERLRPIVAHLEGHDISTAMLKKATARKIYDRLVKSDLQNLALPPKSADLVTATDVFIYVGALERVFAAVATALTEDGLFAFTVEEHEGPEDFVLRDTRRYAHSEAYVLHSLHISGLLVVSLTAETIRMDRGASVEGLFVAATCTN